jgi:apolipoprotein N-acyltransferase
MVTDGYGRFVARLALGEEGVLDSGLPRALSPTVFALAGNTSAYLLLLVFALVVIFIGRKNRTAPARMQRRQRNS